MSYKKTINTLLIFAAVGFTTACSTPAKKEATNDSKEATSKEKNAPQSKNTPTKSETVATNTPPVNNGEAPQITFEKSEYDFGEVKEGDVVKYKYKFKNTGKSELLIANAVGSCGCTVPKWNKEPIAPNGSGEIEVEFNSAGKAGSNTKTVTITANTEPAETKITIKGFVRGTSNLKGPLANPQ